MIAPVSTGILPENHPTQTVTKPVRRKKKRGVSKAIGRRWFAVPDLGDEQRTAMNAAGVMPVYVEICTLLNRKTYAAKRLIDQQKADGGVLEGVGIKGLARRCQCDPKTAAKKLRWLEEHGFLRIVANGQVVVRDPRTGEITKNKVGRQKSSTIILTTRDEQLRPRKVRGTDSPYSDKSREAFRGNDSTTTTATFCGYRGNGSAPIPISNSPRSVFDKSKTRQPSSGESGRLTGGQMDEQREPRQFTGDDAARLRATRERLERERRAREAEDEAFRQRAAYAAPAADKPPHSKREEETVEKPRTAAQPHPRPSRPPSRREERGEAGWNQDEMLRLLNEQVAAALRSPDGVSMTRAEYPARAIEREVA